MTGFLIRRPIAVTMAFLGIIALGLVAAAYLPVSLVPDVDIPRISVRVDAQGYSARQLEHAVMDRLRTRLMQVNNLKELRSEARDGSGVISLEFEYGTNVDLAYIEINEQVDRAAASLPRDIPRPAVIKASASDIPVFYLEISYRDPQGEASASDFLELSAFADEIIRRRLEQIPQVAMADMSGRDFPEIVITPRQELLQAMNLAPEAIEGVIRAANVSFGNIVLRDKQYQYHVRVGNPLMDAGAIGRLYLKHHDRLWQLQELCLIETRSREPEGMVLSQKKRAMSMAIIKQGDARMQDLKKQLHAQVEQLSMDYPHLEFLVTRDQTALLDVTLSNLQQTLVLGGLLAFVVMFLFLGDARAPWLIMLTVPSALVVSLLFFFLAGISLNVISISGLILCIGMMIDNSIIVIDNISRYRRQGLGLYEACVKGTNEVFTPLLSSVLTTCSVFIPLVFLGGLAGAMFFDQAMAVSIGLLVSLAVAMILIPVYYHIMYRRAPRRKKPGRALLDFEALYSRGFRLVMRRQWVVWSLLLLLSMAMIALPAGLARERLPQMQRQALLLQVDWNENIHLQENQRRLLQLIDTLGELVTYSSIQAGRQQFMLGSLHNNSRQQSLLYLQGESPQSLDAIAGKAAAFLGRHYPPAIYQFGEEGNLFDQVFGDRQPPLELRLTPLNAYGSQMAAHLQATLQGLSQQLPTMQIQTLPLQQTLLLEADLQLMALHQVDMASLQRSLARIFNENLVVSLVDQRSVLPVKLGGNPASLGQMLQQEKVRNREGTDIPLSLLLRQSYGQELQHITAGLEGEYFPLPLHISGSQLEHTTRSVRELLRQGQLFDASFAGSLYAQKELMGELLLIGAVALLLLFFILAAQFESLKLPFIVLLEVPLAMTGAMVMLWIFGQSLNLMSMIGMVVMAGIIINDSILKIDTINRLRAGGMPLIRALHTAGIYRLKPILMTSVTTICALLPVLFISGLGGDLQKPLALTVIGGLGLGTFVSLFFIPVWYYWLYRK